MVSGNSMCGCCERQHVKHVTGSVNKGDVHGTVGGKRFLHGVLDGSGFHGNLDGSFCMVRERALEDCSVGAWLCQLALYSGGWSGSRHDRLSRRDPGGFQLAFSVCT